MKNLFTSMLLAFIASASVFCQPPQSFKYQAVVRDATGEIMSNQSVDLRISIRNGSSGGIILYQETFLETTNQFGMVTLNIGTGTPLIGTFADVDWSSGSKFMQVDKKEGSVYNLLGTSELSSVPYALFTERSADAYWELDNSNIFYNGGNVGIGTNTPDTRLAIKTSAAGDVLKILDNTDNTVAKLRHTGNNSGALYLYDGSNNNTVFLYGLGTSFINGGPLGLGTSSVSNAKLQIEGIGTYDAMVKLNNTGTNGASFFMGSTNDAWGGGANQNLFVMGHGAPSSANIDMVVTSTGRLGIGTTTPTAALEVSSASGNVIYGHSPGGTAVYGSSGTSTGIYGQSSSGFAGFFSGSVYVSGSLSKGSGSFVIDHPLDPENKLLRHNFVESPENLLIYRGKAQLNANGEAIVEMPDYFKALTKEDEASIVVTSVGRPFMTGYEWENGNESFKVYGDPNRSVSWIVCADRDDPVIHELARPVEEEKGGDNKLCEKGKLLYPKAYGYPETAGRNYEMTKLNSHNK
ncbi:MAG: hypothetical protein R2764_19435 [Bacteroidales bacterium]